MHLPKLTAFRRYHVALSYAGEDRRYVEEVKTLLESHGLRVYFGDGPGAPEIGLPLLDHLADVFEHRAQHCLVFISRFYTGKPTTMQELQAALRRHRTLESPLEDPYILPARFDDTPVPDLPDIIFANVGPKKTPEELAWLVRNRVLESARRKSRRPLAAQAEEAPVHFIGRKAELRELEQALRRNRVPLLVLHGDGGTGKTWLALKLLERLRGYSIYPVSLKPPVGGEKEQFLRTREEAERLVFSAIAQTVGVRETERVSMVQSLTQYLEQRPALLLLDGFEHFIKAGPAVEDLTHGCPGLQVLITSRFQLRKLRTAQHYPLEPLKRADAIQLFKQRGRDVGARFKVRGHEKDLDEICGLLGDLALAIEVVAGASYGYELPEIVAELRLYLKGGGGGDSRLGLQKVMHASIRRSYDILPPDEQQLFRHLAVFAGGCTAESAFRVCDKEGENGSPKEIPPLFRDGLERLTEKALLRRESKAGASRFEMTDTVREFALHCLRQSEGEAETRRRHARYFAGLAETADRGIKSPKRPEHMAELERERDNLKAVLDWSRSMDGDRQMGLRLAGSLFWFWNLRAEFTEGKLWLQEPLQSCGVPYAQALYSAGGLAFLRGEYPQAKPLLEASVAVWRTLGPAHEGDLGYALIVLGMTVLGLNDLDGALGYEEEARRIFERQRNEDPWGLALALNDLGNVRRRRGESREALELYQRSLALWGEGDTWGIPLTRSNLGFLLMMDRKFDEARNQLKEALKTQQDADDRWGSAETLKYLGDLAVREENFQEAEGHYLESVKNNQEIGRRQFMIGCLAGLAVSSARQRMTKLTAFLYGAVEFLATEYKVSARILDEEMFRQAWNELDPELRDSPGFRKEYDDGARPESPSAKLERATKRVFRDLPSSSDGDLPPLLGVVADIRPGPKKPGAAAEPLEGVANLTGGAPPVQPLSVPELNSGRERPQS